VVALWVFTVSGIPPQQLFSRGVLVLAAQATESIRAVLLAPLLRAYRAQALQHQLQQTDFFIAQQTQRLLVLAGCFAHLGVAV
jgi:hypothetical protein